MKKILIVFTFLLSSFAIASESSIYDFSWLDSDKEIYVLQNRKFRKDGTFYVGGTLHRQMNSTFIDSLGVDLLGGFFFAEDWGIEIGYTKASGDENKTHDGVRTQGAVAFYRKVETVMSAMVMWSPFYSKINTFNKVFYFDVMFGLGLASVTTKDNRNKFIALSRNDLTEETNTGLSWAIANRFFITKNWSTRIDFRAIHLSADNATGSIGASKTEKKWNHYYNIGIGLNYTF
ncbi:MAG: outer membrane beta-barrel domain-containing protein [Bacteriovoracaceae bacterium]|jgi:outer membrane beta-barrel protein|nr:outer membrane beta-barrel domain-containing protein [Bacteriovoracaceae bacterium]